MNEFIEKIAPIIKSMGMVFGYKYPSAIIAQAVVESNYGKSILSAKYHNYFGLKCGKSWRGKSVNMKTKEEYTAGVLTEISDNFRVFDDIFMGVLGYFNFIGYKRYNNLKDATSPRDYLVKIVADGYCTSTRYVNTCMNVIDEYNLTEWD